MSLGKEKAKPALPSWGNKSLFNVAEIARNHQMNLIIPPTIIVSTMEHYGTRDRLIYNDPKNGKLVVRKTPMEIVSIRRFID